MKYELDLKTSRIDYIPQTQKKHFKAALEYCLKNNIICCMVNKTTFWFDFDNLKVKIKGSRDNYIYTYNLKECE